MRTSESGAEGVRFMRFELTDEQQMLGTMARDFASSRCSDQVLADVALDPASHHRTSAWKELAELGLTTLIVPESAGGAGGSVTDACVVAEAFGESITPLPFVASAMVAPEILGALGATDELTDLVDGKVFTPIVGSALGWPATTTQAVAWDWLPDAVGLHVVGNNANASVSTTTLNASDIVWPTFDPLHPLVRVDVDPTAADAIDEQTRQRVVAVGRVGLAAFSLGLATRALNVANEYAKERVQYGKPIGTFQAVQHMLADMLVDVETTRSIVYGAAWTVSDGEPATAHRLAASAFTWATNAAIRTSETGIQVLGGIGVTEEHTAHRGLRSAHSSARALGGVAASALELAALRISQVQGR